MEKMHSNGSERRKTGETKNVIQGSKGRNEIDWGT